MKLHDLRPPAGSNRPRRRVGRGIAGKGGKTAGRGTKGTGARNTVPPGFEGGQLPLAQRIPKLKGFHNPFRVAYAVVNLDTLDDFRRRRGHPRDPGGRRAWSRKGALVKVLGRGELHRAVRVEVHAVSASRPRRHRGRRRQVELSCPCPSATAGRRRGATPSPTGSLVHPGYWRQPRTRRGGALEPQEHLQGS